MKKILYILMCHALLFAGCGKNDDAHIIQDERARVLYNSLNNKAGVQIDDIFPSYGIVVINKDGEEVEDGYFLLGRRNKKLWFAVFDRVGDNGVKPDNWSGSSDMMDEMREMIRTGVFKQRYEWTDLVEQDTIKIIDKGYGKFDTVQIRNSVANNKIYKNKSGYCYLNSSDYSPYSSRAVFIPNNSAATFVDVGGNSWDLRVKFWTEDTYAIYYYSNNYNTGFVYNQNGSLELEVRGYDISVGYCKPFTLTDVIYNVSYIFGEIYQERMFYRYKLNDSSAGYNPPTKIWETKIMSDIPNNARFDKQLIPVKKEGAVWTYKAEMTLYSGEKIVRNFTINIDTGAFAYVQ